MARAHGKDSLSGDLRTSAKTFEFKSTTLIERVADAPVKGVIGLFCDPSIYETKKERKILHTVMPPRAP